jgi:hypothetical protein
MKEHLQSNIVTDRPDSAAPIRALFKAKTPNVESYPSNQQDIALFKEHNLLSSDSQSTKVVGFALLPSAIPEMVTLSGQASLRPSRPMR